MSEDFDDFSIILTKPRRMQILRLLMEQGTMRISDIKKILNAPASSVYYDVEVLRANGLVIKDGPYVKITTRGRELMEKLGGVLGNSQWGTNSTSRISKVVDALLMRPIIINMYRLGPNTLFLYSIIIVTLGLVMAFAQGYELVLLVFMEGLNFMPISITVASILTYIGVALFIHKYLLGSGIVDQRVLSGVVASLIPISIYPTIMALITPWTPPLPLSIIDSLLKALLPLASMIILATVLSISSGKPMEYPLLFETLLLLIPSLIIYIVLIK